MSDRTETVRALEIATNWLHEFESALVADDMKAVAGMFVEDSYWRDLVAFTWHLRTFSGRASIISAMHDLMPSARPQNFALQRTVRLLDGSIGPAWMQSRQSSASRQKPVEGVACCASCPHRGTRKFRKLGLADNPGRDKGPRGTNWRTPAARRGMVGRLRV